MSKFALVLCLVGLVTGAGLRAGHPDLDLWDRK
jgi:hypothetical protein